MRRSLLRFFGYLIVGLMLSTMLSCDGGGMATPSLLDSLPADPIGLWYFRVESAVTVWDEGMGRLATSLDEDELAEMRRHIDEIADRLGVSVRDDILAHLGQQSAVVIDLPSIDSLADAGEAIEAIVALSSAVGVVAEVENRQPLEAALRRAFEGLDLDVVPDQGLMRIRFEEDELPSVYFGLTDERLAVAADRSWVETALSEREAASSLTAGADFVAVMRHMQADATSLMYLNLPKIQDRLRSSEFARTALAEQSWQSVVVRFLLDPALAPVGVGISESPVDDGSRRVVYGPRWLALGAGGGPEEPALLWRLPRDPIAAIVVRVGDLVASWDALLQFIAELGASEGIGGPDQINAMIQTFLGVSLRDEFLARIGPEVAFVLDLPPLDILRGGDLDSLRTGFILQTSAPAELEASMRSFFARATMQVTEEDGLIRVSTGSGRRSKDFVLGFEGETMALGVSAAWVRATLAGRRSGNRLADGDDFKRVARHLDGSPCLVGYANLPKLQAMVRDSGELQRELASEPAMNGLIQMILDPEAITSGFGISNAVVDGGARWTVFGPRWSAAAAPAAAVAPVAIGATTTSPSLRSDIELGKARRTMADMRTLATAMETFAVDHGRYPVGNLDEVAAQISPEYIRQVPRLDGWGNPFDVHSNGDRYEIRSLGRDGEFTLRSNGPTTDPDADIIHENGSFSQWPEGAYP